MRELGPYYASVVRNVLYDILLGPQEPALTPDDFIRAAMRRRKPVRPARKDRSAIKAARKQRNRAQ